MCMYIICMSAYTLTWSIPPTYCIGRQNTTESTSVTCKGMYVRVYICTVFYSLIAVALLYISGRRPEPWLLTGKVQYIFIIYTFIIYNTICLYNIR